MSPAFILPSDDPRSIIGGEKCGLSAAVNIEEAARLALTGAVLMDHRGQVAFGAVSVDKGKFHPLKKRGSVRERFRDVDSLRDLPGKTAIVHNRYATAGDPEARKNIQPLVFSETRFGTPIAIAHNGTFSNYSEIRKELIERGSPFQSTTDTETFVHLMTHSGESDIEGAIRYALDRIQMAYALLILTRDKLYAIRDRFGVRPLSVARLGGGYLVLSENYPFGESIPDSEFLFDIEPGEIVEFPLDGTGYRRIRYAEANDHFCVFERIYFSHPRSTYRGYYHEDFRQQLGLAIARDNPGLQADAIVPLLDSGKQAAIGLQKGTGLPYREYFQRTHHPLLESSRSFTSPTYEERQAVALMKQHLRRDKIQGKRIILVDDTIVRAITILIAIERIRAAGASEVTVVISAPPVSNVCPSGMDYQSTDQLVASGRNNEEIREIIRADRLIYQSLGSLNEVVRLANGCSDCTGCFGGKYPSAC